MKSEIRQLNLFPTIERGQLEEKYSPLINERLDFRAFLGFRLNKAEPIFRWFRFKEAFSHRLVKEILTKEWKLPSDSLIFDPFAGCGTTLLACQQLGYPAIGVDILPIAVFAGKVKLHAEYDLDELRRTADKLRSKPFSATGKSFPKIRIIDLALPQEAQEELLFYREQISNIQEPSTRDFLMLGLLASIEEASYTSKDGQFLRLVERAPKSVEVVFENKLGEMLADLSKLDGAKQEPKAQIFLGDARRLPIQVMRYKGRVSGIITSPPYLNRYDYSRTYALELCLLYDERGEPLVKDFEDLKYIRHRLLRSHIESRSAPTNLVKVPALEEVLNCLELKQLNNPRIPIMIEGYFEDMNLAIREMAKMLKPGGLVALVVDNVRFEGELIPVDLILSEIAAKYKLRTIEVRVPRYKGNSSQQMGRFGRVPVRESIVFWQKEILGGSDDLL
jgi:SAM-dependent methyltransferase